MKSSLNTERLDPDYVDGFCAIFAVVFGFLVLLVLSMGLILAVYFVLPDFKKNPEAGTSGEIQISNNL